MVVTRGGYPWLVRLDPGSMPPLPEWLPDQVRHDEGGGVARSRPSPLIASINSIFHLRCQFLICFSRLIAACIVPASSNQTSVLTGGAASDYTAAEPLMAIPVATPKALLADKGYDGDRFRESLLVRGILPIIPPRSNRKVPEHPD